MKIESSSPKPQVHKEEKPSEAARAAPSPSKPPAAPAPKPDAYTRGNPSARQFNAAPPKSEQRGQTPGFVPDQATVQAAHAAELAALAPPAKGVVPGNAPAGVRQPTGERPTTTVALNVRSTPEAAADNSNRLGTFAEGSKLEVIPDSTGKAREGDWVHVQGRLPGGQKIEGWVSGKYLASEKLENTDSLNFRSSPEKTADNSNRLGTLPPNSALEVVPDASGKARDGNWVHIQSSVDGKPVQGWVSSDFVRAASANPSGPASPAGPVSGPGPVQTAPPVGGVKGVYQPYEVAPGASVNGRLGLHWRSDQYDGDMGRAQAILDKARQMGVGYSTILVDPGNPEAQKALIEKMQQNGITPVVRMYKGNPPDTWSKDEIDQMASCAKELAGMGVKLIQVGNEPNLEGKPQERGLSNQQYMEASTRKQAEAMLAVKSAVGDSAKVGLPPVGCGCPDNEGWGTQAPQTYYPAMLQAIRQVEKESGRQICDWIPTHTYTMGQPGTDGPSQMGQSSRGQLGWGPDTGAWYEEKAAQILGRRMNSLSTEGGAEPNAFQGENRQGGNADAVKAQMDEALRQMQNNPRATNCLWLLQDAPGQRDSWSQMALVDGERAFASGLDAYRQTFHNAGA